MKDKNKHQRTSPTAGKVTCFSLLLFAANSVTYAFWDYFEAQAEKRYGAKRCNEIEIGLTIYKTVDNVDSIAFLKKRLSAKEQKEYRLRTTELLEDEYHYNLSEYRTPHRIYLAQYPTVEFLQGNSDGAKKKVDRYTRPLNGNEFKHEIARSLHSIYAVDWSSISTDEDRRNNIDIGELRIINLREDEVLAIHRGITWLNIDAGNFAVCPLKAGNTVREVVTSVLKPNPKHLVLDELLNTGTIEESKQ